MLTRGTEASSADPATAEEETKALVLEFLNLKDEGRETVTQ
jgi:hypothetical protein